MEELGDKDFDQIFKNKIKDGYLAYEEESWLKMEKKLRKRDQFVFYRNASIILMLLSFGIGIYLANNKKSPTGDVNAVKKAETIMSLPLTKRNKLSEAFLNTAKNRSHSNETIMSLHSQTEMNKLMIASSPLKSKLYTDEKIKEFKIENSSKTTHITSKDESFNVKPEIISKPVALIASQITAVDSATRVAQNLVDTQNSQAQKNQPSKVASKFPISLSINVGPDFSSTENTIGGKSGMAVGIGISIALSQKLSLQTGLNYGSKNYEAQGYNYTFNNPNTVNIIAGIDASCKVLEIPLRASYKVMDNQKNSIDLNAGLSSYIMLKENYRFIYTAASARKDRLLEEKNANQHYLSIINLSATYNIKLKNKSFALGVEPYVKLPLSGIGEGSVPLKSSGISLKLNYELNKKK